MPGRSGEGLVQGSQLSMWGRVWPSNVFGSLVFSCGVLSLPCLLCFATFLPAGEQRLRGGQGRGWSGSAVGRRAWASGTCRGGEVGFGS